MRRKIFIKSTGSIITKIQCPNPSCEEILDILSNDYLSGMNNIESICPSCGDEARVVYFLEDSQRDVQDMMLNREAMVSVMNNKTIPEG